MRQPFALGPAVGLFALLCVVLASPWLSGAVTIPWDAKSQFLPQVRFLARALAEGQSPLWTPHVFAGWPQVADPQSLLFSPLHVLLAYLDPHPGFRSLDAVTFALLFLSGLGILLFFRDRGWHVGGALVAALALAFGGSCAARLQHTGQIVSLAYLPLALWLLARALDRGSWRYGAAAGLFIGLIALGRDQVALLSLYLLAGFVVAHWLAGNGRAARLRASARPLAAAGIMALAIAGLPVLMTALLAARSNRPEIGLLFAGRGSLHPANLLSFVFADLYGTSGPHFWGPPSFAWTEAWGPTNLFVAQNMGQIYAGAMAAVTILGLGLARGLMAAREIRFFTIAAALTLLYALGWYTPAFAVMHAMLPGVSLFRRPADATFLLGFLLSVIAGYLVHRWLAGTVAAASRRRILTDVALAFALIAAAVATARSVGTLGVALGPILTGIAWVLGAIAALALARCLAPRPFAAAIVLAVFTAADLGWNHAPNPSTGLPPSRYEPLEAQTRNATVALLGERLAEAAAPDRRDRIELTGIGYAWPNLSLVHGFDHVFGHNPLRLAAFARATGVGDTVAIPEQRTFSPLFPSYRSALADLLGLRFIATGVPLEEIDRSLAPRDLKLIARTADAYVYENPRALPRVMLLTDCRPADFEALIREGGWPVDPGRTVLLERMPPRFRPSAAGGSARILSYANDTVEVETRAPAGGILVLNDVWHPWWRASIDGTATEILRANVLFRAVVVPPGEHRVRFTFHPFLGALAETAEKISAAWR
jgi:hypothetical protein